MALKEYQKNHYKLWDYIAYSILQAKEWLIIPDLKTEWLHANYKPVIANNCFICDYLLGSRSPDSSDSCEECIKMLGFRRNGECLGGLYRDCVMCTSYIEQYKKACEIRDIWGGNPT